MKAGHDFPSSLEQTFEQWNVNLHIIRENEEPSSRGRILYGESASERTYQRLTSPLPSTTTDIAAADMVSAACFHFFDIPETVNTQIDEICTPGQETLFDVPGGSVAFGKILLSLDM